MPWECPEVVCRAAVMILDEDSCLWRRLSSVTTRSFPTLVLCF